MSLSTTINYDIPGNFTYDSSLIDITTTAGLKDLRPANATCYAGYTSSIDLLWGDGVLTGAASGGAAVSGGKLDLAHSDIRYVDYDADLNADSQQTGCIRFKMTPNFSGAPGVYMGIFCITKATTLVTNCVQFIISNAGNLFLQIYDQSDVLKVNLNCGIWSPTSGVEYEFEINYDLTSGASRVFIDGVQFGSTSTATGTRSSDIGLLRIGNYPSPTQTSNFKIDDLMIFSTVQHTANYTPASYGTTIYSTANPTILLNSTTAMDGLDGFSEVASKTGSDEVKYTIVVAGQDKYWNGSAWANSAGTYAQANTAAEIETNKASLDLSTGYNVKIMAFLHSDDGSTTPTLTSNEISYDFYVAPPMPIAECITYVYLDDLLQDIDDFTAIDATFHVKSDVAFEHTGKTIIPFEYDVDFTAGGYAEFSVIETETVDKYLEFRVTYTEDARTKEILFNPVIVPNQTTVNLLTITDPA